MRIFFRIPRRGFLFGGGGGVGWIGYDILSDLTRDVWEFFLSHVVGKWKCVSGCDQVFITIFVCANFPLPSPPSTWTVLIFLIIPNHNGYRFLSHIPFPIGRFISLEEKYRRVHAICIKSSVKYIYIIYAPSLRSRFTLFDQEGEHGRFEGSSEGATREQGRARGSNTGARESTQGHACLGAFYQAGRSK